MKSDEFRLTFYNFFDCLCISRCRIDSRDRTQRTFRAANGHVMHNRVPATRPSPLCPNCVENSATHRVLLPLALSSILLYGVSIASFGLLIFEATTRPRRCAASLSSHGAALGVLPSRVAPSCMIFTVSFPLGLVCLGALDVFFSSRSPPRSVAQCHLQHHSVSPLHLCLYMPS